MFSVGASERPGHLAAYAERVGDPAARRIWYFPTRGGAQPAVAPGAETRVLPEGVKLGPPLEPGRYRVHVWLSETPVERTDGESPAGGSEILLEIRE